MSMTLLRLTPAVFLLLSFVLLNLNYCTTQYYQTIRNNNNQSYPYQHSRSNFNHHHHHHHNHPFGHNHGNFGGPMQGKPSPSASGNVSTIPMDVYEELDRYTEMNELLENFVDGYKEEDVPLNSRFDDDGPPVIKAKCPKCEPELKTIDIVAEEDPNIVYIPKCVRIERCGGCCASKLYSCQPTQIENARYEVQILEYFEKGKFKEAKTQIRTIQKHKRCKCGCRIKATDCNRFQVYNKAACRCMCSNFEEERRCYEENATKIWEPDTCSCQCRNIYQCSTGFIFDILSCKCMAYSG